MKLGLTRNKLNNFPTECKCFTLLGRRYRWLIVRSTSSGWIIEPSMNDIREIHEPIALFCISGQFFILRSAQIDNRQSSGNLNSKFVENLNFHFKWTSNKIQLVGLGFMFWICGTGWKQFLFDALLWRFYCSIVLDIEIFFFPFGYGDALNMSFAVRSLSTWWISGGFLLFDVANLIGLPSTTWKTRFRQSPRRFYFPILKHWKT